MNSQIVELSAVGILSFLVIKELIIQLVARRNKTNGACFDIATKEQIHQLYDWHNVTDGDGVKVWYVRRSLEKAVMKLSENIDNQTNVIRELTTVVKTLSKDIDKKGR